MLLAIDTSTSKRGSVALYDPVSRSIAGYRTVDLANPLAVGVAELVPDLSIIEHYAVTIGPGSFTGLRIGIAFLKGLAFVHPRPVVPVSTLCVLAQALFESDPTVELALPMLDARRNEAYAALYTRSLLPHSALKEAAHPIAAIRAAVSALPKVSVLAGGDGVALDHGIDPPWVIAPQSLWSVDARTLAAIAVERIRDGVDAASLEPAYLQLAPAEIEAASRSAH